MKPHEMSAENWSTACTMARTAALALADKQGGDMQVHGVGNIAYFTDPETNQQFKLTVEPVEA